MNKNLLKVILIAIFLFLYYIITKYFFVPNLISGVIFGLIAGGLVSVFVEKLYSKK